MAFSILIGENWHELCISSAQKNRFVVWKISFSVIFRFISDEISAEKILLGHFYSTKRFVFEFQGEPLEQFLSYRAHFRRYQHFRGFWLSTARSYRDCKCFIKFMTWTRNPKVRGILGSLGIWRSPTHEQLKRSDLTEKENASSQRNALYTQGWVYIHSFVFTIYILNHNFCFIQD